MFTSDLLHNAFDSVLLPFILFLCYFRADIYFELLQIYQWAILTDFRKVLGFQAKHRHPGNLRETRVTDDISKHVI